MASAIILGALSIGIVYIASYLYFEKDSQVISLLVCLCAIFGVFTSIWYAAQTAEQNMQKAFQNVLVSMKTEEKIECKKEIPELYYKKAELAFSEKQDDGTYKIQFFVQEAGAKKYERYEIVSDKEYDNTVPYLLTIISNGTESTSDDELAVVWKDMN